MMKCKSLFIFSILMMFSVTQVVPAAYASYAIGNAPGEVSNPSFIENLVQNEGFESDIGGGGRNWDATANRGLGVTTAADAPEGGRYLTINENNIGGAEFPFTFQTITAPVSPGDTVDLSALVRFEDEDGATEGRIAQIVTQFADASGTNLAVAAGHIGAQAADTGGAFVFTQVNTTAPATAASVVVVLRIQNAVAGTPNDNHADFDDVKLTVNSHPVRIQAASSSPTMSPSDASVLSVNLVNRTAGALAGVEVVVEPQQGIQINRDETGFDGASGTGGSPNLPSRDGSVIYSVGTLAAGQSSAMAIPFVLTSAVVPGKTYSIKLAAQNAAGDLSQDVEVTITVEADPVFHLGTVIGKVFNDKNRNTVQDPGEEGIPFANIVTEEGIIVTTDKNGKYHIPGLKPGRHVLKIDGHTLPPGTEFVTEEAYLIKTTPGLMNKVNFAVAAGQPDDWEGGPVRAMSLSSDEDLSVFITQGVDNSLPELDVTMQPDILKLGVGLLEENPAFTFDTNYGGFIKKWTLEIRNEMGKKIWSGYGIGQPPADVIWEGLTDKGVLVEPGIYSYQLKVENEDGLEDWSMLKVFRVHSKISKEVYAEDWEGLVTKQMTSSVDYKGEKNYRDEISPVGNFNIFQDGKRSIPIVAKPTVNIRGYAKPDHEVYVNDYPVKVDPATGLFSREFFVEPGDQDFVVTSISPDGESTIYSERVHVKDSMFFAVALGEQELGYNFASGGSGTFSNDEQLRDGHYQDGRFSYYLKAKLKGKFLIKSHYDTGEEQSALFTNLDPDDFYPTYGDESQINYDAQNGRERFFMEVEMDRSFARWGSFQTEFNETELGSYNRSLSGLKIHYEALTSTSYGDPKAGFTLFWSEAKHRADHNELRATGGTLYYLRHRDIIQGSEKLKVEVRDKIQNIAIGRYDLREGVDYEIDYDEGRVLLSRPLSSVAAAHNLVNNDLLDGNPVYLIADYEYDEGLNVYEDNNRGIRGYTHMGDHIRVGATLVEEKRNNVDYDLRAVDLTMKIGRNTKIIAEYATSMQQQVDQGVSFDGGLSYANLTQLNGDNTRPRENAYLIKAESKPMKNVEINGFIQGVEPGFSNDVIRSQEGFKKYGVATKWTLTDNLHAKYRYDNSEVVGQLLPLEEHGIFAPYETLTSHTAGVVYDDGKYLGEIEYMRRKIDHSDAPFSDNINPSLESEIPMENGIAAKVGYRVNEKLMPYVKAQVEIGGKGNHQFGGGFRYEVVNNVFAYLEQMFGKVGDSTLFGFEKVHENGTTTYANLKSQDRGIGYKTLSTAIGTNYFMENGSRFYSEREHSTYNGVDGFADILGYEGGVGDHWDFGGRYERRHLNNSTTRFLDVAARDALTRTNTWNTIAGHVAYAGDAFVESGEDWEGSIHGSTVEVSPWKKLRARSYWEYRRDQDVPKLWQVVTRNSLEYQINEDVSFLSYLNYGFTRQRDPEDIPGDFMEFNTGFAYRPVDHDKLNMLGRYTYVRNIANDAQFTVAPYNGIEIDEAAHVFSLDLSYDVNRYWSLVEKIAFKHSTLGTSSSEDLSLNSFLWANRINFHVTRKWDVALEYRLLFQSNGAQTLQHGALIEVDREIYEYVKLGLGYDFSDFTDDLRKPSSYTSHGPYMRMTGKF